MFIISFFAEEPDPTPGSPTQIAGGSLELAGDVVETHFYLAGLLSWSLSQILKSLKPHFFRLRVLHRVSQHKLRKKKYLPHLTQKYFHVFVCIPPKDSSLDSMLKGNIKQLRAQNESSNF